MNPTPEKQRIRIVSKKDVDVSYFCGSGAGGQARNKVASGVQIIHRESGAIGRASDSRSQDQNKHAAFKRMTETPKFKFWLARKMYEINQQETLEETVSRDMENKNLKCEIRNAEGKWEQVDPAYFESVAAKDE